MKRFAFILLCLCMTISMVACSSTLSMSDEEKQEFYEDYFENEEYQAEGDSYLVNGEDITMKYTLDDDGYGEIILDVDEVFVHLYRVKEGVHISSQMPLPENPHEYMNRVYEYEEDDDENILEQYQVELDTLFDSYEIDKVKYIETEDGIDYVTVKAEGKVDTRKYHFYINAKTHKVTSVEFNDGVMDIKIRFSHIKKFEPDSKIPSNGDTISNDELGDLFYEVIRSAQKPSEPGVDAPNINIGTSPSVPEWEDDNEDYVKPETPLADGAAIPGWAKLRIPANTKEDIVVDFFNPFANEDKYYLSFELRIPANNEHGYEAIYTSGLITPGKHIQSIDLIYSLDAGEYDAVLRVRAYKMTDNALASTNDLKLTLIVQ